MKSTAAASPNHPCNNSPSKQHWSFGKAPRFTSAKSTCRRSFYDHRSCLSARSISMGVGKRSGLFQGNKDTLEPAKYSVPSQFGKTRRGFSFTAGRDQVKFENYLNTRTDAPDPTKYNVAYVNFTSRTCTIKERTPYPPNYFLPNQQQAGSRAQLPGPGQYEPVDTIGSNYRTKSPNHNVVFLAGSRFKYEKSSTPGPQDYANKTIEPDGIYLLSNMKSSGRRSFLNGKRVTQLDASTSKDTPGPGCYRIPSEFGSYDNPLNQSMKKSSQPKASRPSTAFR